MRQRQTDQTRAGSSLSLRAMVRVTPQNWMPPNSSVALLINRWLPLMGCTQPENLPADPAPSLHMHWDSHQVFVLVDVCGYMGNWTKPKSEMVWFWSYESQKRIMRPVEEIRYLSGNKMNIYNSFDWFFCLLGFNAAKCVFNVFLM